jgi:hypothetical protein
MHTGQRKGPDVIKEVIGTARAFTYNPKLYKDLMLVFGALMQLHKPCGMCISVDYDRRIGQIRFGRWLTLVHLIDFIDFVYQ